MPDQYRRYHEDDYRRGGRRDWSDRAGDEVRSWFGDDDARARRGNDERNDRYPYGGDRDRGWSADRWSGGERPHADRISHGERPQGSSYGDRDRGYMSGERNRSWQDRGDDQRDGGRGYGERGYQERGYDQDRLYRQDSSGDDRDRFGRGGDDGRSRGWMQDDASSGRGPGWSDRDGGRSWRDQSGVSGQSDGRSGGSWFRDGSHQRESYSGRGPKDYKRSDDRIREDISDRLTDDHGVDASDITVQVQGGEVTLSGSVPSRDQKRRAEDVAESCSGVSEVTNNIRVHKSHGSTEGGASHGTTQAGSQGGGKNSRSTTGTSA
jgi:hypothetical protein